MTPDTRGRVGSVSKLWTATVVLRLADEGELGLDDTVEHWLPHFFPYGKRVTVRELLDHTSGMIDDNDLQARPQYWLAKIHDPRLRAELLRLFAAAQENPRVRIPAMLEMRTAAALPLLFAPGTGYHYSNIGYKTAGAIAEKAGGSTLAQLYDRIIVKPLGLTSAGYDPYAAIAGPHAVGYIVEKGNPRRRRRASPPATSRRPAVSSPTRATRCASSSRSWMGRSSPSRTSRSWSRRATPARTDWARTSSPSAAASWLSRTAARPTRSWPRPASARTAAASRCC